MPAKGVFCFCGAKVMFEENGNSCVPVKCEWCGARFLPYYSYIESLPVFLDEHKGCFRKFNGEIIE